MDKGSLLAKETSIVFTRILEIDSKAAIKNPARQGFFIYLTVLINYSILPIGPLAFICKYSSLYFLLITKVEF